MQFTGTEAIDNKQAAEVIASTLTGFGIAKTEYTFGGPPRGKRFSVKFKPGAGQHTQPKEAAKYVKEQFKPKADEDWKTINFNRAPGGTPVEFSFQYDMASNQAIKEVVVKHMYKMVKDKEGCSDYKAFKLDGTLYNDFKLVARVIFGFREDTFQVKWEDKATFEASGFNTDDVDKELKSVFARWCL